MTRRALAAAACAASAAALTACGAHQGQGTVPQGSPTDPAIAASPLIGVSFDLDNQVRRAELRALQDAAALRGARLRVVSAANDPRVQRDQIARLLGRDRVAAVIAVPQDRKAILASMDAAAARRVPFVALDRAPAPDPGTRLAATVTGAPEADGRAAGAHLRSLGRPLRVLHLWGALNDENALGRRKGFNTATATGGVTVAAQARTDWLPDRARRETVDALRKDPTIDAIFVPSDFLLPAVLDGLRQRRRLKPRGHPHHVTVVTVDGDPVGCAALRQGYIDADVATPVGELGRRALDAAVTAIKRPDAPALTLRLAGTLTRPGDERRAWGCRSR